MSFEHLSFIDLFETENLIVEIPMLQRDYAYGRKTESEKRKEFLKNIKEYLLSENKNHELDFVYGSVSSSPRGKNVLTLLDGQQRITTLFLLHWYFAITNQEYEKFRNLLCDNGKSKFTYNIRESASNFCDALVCLNKKGRSEKGEDTIPQEDEYYKYISDKDNPPLSEKIRNEKWFYNHWNNDPTVTNMLNMLDDIAKTFPLSECNGLFDKLNKSGAEASITFNFLPLDEFKLTDELYIKMNSRGKPLTRFENLKSKILKKYDELNGTNEYNAKLNEINKLENRKYESLRDYVGLMIDTRWTDVFWNFWLGTTNDTNSKPLVDDMFLSFICNICVVFEAIRLVDSSLSMQRNSSEEQKIEELMNVRNNVSYEKILEILQANDNYLLYNLIDILNLISKKNEKNEWVLKTYFNEEVYYFNEKDAFRSIVYDYTATQERNYEPKAIYFGYILYLLEQRPIENDSRFKDWMRFVYDMCKNSYGLSNAVYTFSNCLAGIKYLSSKDIYATLSTKKIDDFNNLVTLDKFQLEEELLKAKLFENEKWKSEIDVALSKLRYFEGQIHFELIDSTEVKGTDVNNEEKINEFASCVNKVAAIFDKRDGCTFDSELVRALLSKGDYTTSYKSSKSLFRNGSGRDISWLRYHKTENLENGAIDKRNYLKQVLNDSDFDYTKPKESLGKIADNRSDKLTEWQKTLIDNLRVFEKSINDFSFGSNRLLRWNSANKKHDRRNEDNCEIDLISKQQITSKHSELFTYSLYCKNKDKEISPFNKPKYVLQDSEDAQPFMVYGPYAFNSSNYYMQLHYADDKKIKLRFLNWNDANDTNETVTDDTILSVIQMHSFTKENNEEAYTKLVDIDEVISSVKSFCDSLLAV